MNTGSTNISLFRYSIRENNNCYQNQSSLRLKFSFKIYSPTLGFYSLRELMSGEIALDNIVDHLPENIKQSEFNKYLYTFF